jgi:hypothetical protein
MIDNADADAVGQDAEGWSAIDVPDGDTGEDLMALAGGFRELGVDEAEVQSTLKIMKDPTAAGMDLVQSTLVDIGASREFAAGVVKELEGIQMSEPVGPGVLLDWGPDPSETYHARLMEVAAIRERRRRERVKVALLKAFGFDIPLGPPHFETAIVPILVLAAPAVAGAKVEWTAIESAGGSCGFELTLLGSGLGASRTISIESSRKEVCEDGQARLIELHAPVLAQPIGRHRKGRVESQRLRRELAAPGAGVPPRRFLVQSLEESELAALAGPAVEDEDRSKAEAAVEFADAGAVSGKRTLSVGVAYKGAQATLDGTLEEKRAYEARVTLPGGRRYRRYYPVGAFGVMWDVQAV